jgi:hypothetical protein
LFVTTEMDDFVRVGVLAAVSADLRVRFGAGAALHVKAVPSWRRGMFPC